LLSARFSALTAACRPHGNIRNRFLSRPGVPSLLWSRRSKIRRYQSCPDRQFPAHVNGNRCRARNVRRQAPQRSSRRYSIPASRYSFVLVIVVASMEFYIAELPGDWGAAASPPCKTGTEHIDSSADKPWFSAAACSNPIVDIAQLAKNGSDRKGHRSEQCLSGPPDRSRARHLRHILRAAPEGPLFWLYMCMFGAILRSFCNGNIRRARTSCSRPSWRSWYRTKMK